MGFSYGETDGKNFRNIAFFGSGRTIKSGCWVNLSLELIGSKLYFYFEGIQLFSTNLTEPLTSDLVGFLCRSDVDIHIKNFLVEPIPQKAFVIMKYDELYDNLYHEVIKPLCQESGYEVKSADENYSTGMILEDIVNQITESSLIIADITPDNPNVFYELGYAHALKKPTILLNEKFHRESLPFDVSGFRVIFYENSIAGKSEVENRLRQFLQNLII